MTADNSNRRIVDLVDFSAACIETSADLVELPDACQLAWFATAEGTPTGCFYFRPRFGYETEAAESYSIPASNEDWRFHPNEDNGQQLNSLLEKVVWQGRPVLDSLTDFWIAPDLEPHVYEGLLALCRESGSEPQLVKEPQMYSNRSRHNYGAAIHRLLATYSFDGQQAFGWLAPEFHIVGGDQLRGDTLNLTVSSSAVNLWFMADNVLLIQWRMLLGADAFAELQGATSSARLGQDINYLNMLQGELPGSTFDRYLRIVQGIRWLKGAFPEQPAEGKQLKDAEYTLHRMIMGAGSDNHAAPPVNIGKALDSAIRSHIASGADPRVYTSAHVALASQERGTAFNTALQRAFSHLLPLDVVWPDINRVCDNYSADPEFMQAWIRKRSYQRWLATGVQYGYSDYTAVSIGTSDFYRDKILKDDLTGLYSDKTRLCLYQRTALRRFSEQLSDSKSGNYGQLSGLLEKVRAQFQEFNRHGWFQEVSEQVQPQEMYDLQSGMMNIPGLYQGVRDELSDANAYFDVVTAKEEERRRHRFDLWLAMFGLFIGAPTLIETWAEDADRGVFTPFLRMIKTPEGIIICGLVVVGALYIGAKRKTKLPDRPSR